MGCWVRPPPGSTAPAVQRGHCCGSFPGWLSGFRRWRLHHCQHSAALSGSGAEGWGTRRSCLSGSQRPRPRWGGFCLHPPGGCEGGGRLCVFPDSNAAVEGVSGSAPAACSAHRAVGGCVHPGHLSAPVYSSRGSHQPPGTPPVAPGTQVRNPGGRDAVCRVPRGLVHPP